jgi:hypothetical protein
MKSRSTHCTARSLFCLPSAAYNFSFRPLCALAESGELIRLPESGELLGCRSVGTASKGVPFDGNCSTIAGSSAVVVVVVGFVLFLFLGLEMISFGCVLLLTGSADFRLDTGDICCGSGTFTGIEDGGMAARMLGNSGKAAAAAADAELGVNSGLFLYIWA